MLSEQELILLSERGFIPGPHETEEDFLRRTQVSAPPDGLSQAEWHDAHTLTQKLFGFSADWVHAFYSKKSLPFWQGAVTWIEHPPRIQLHPTFKRGSLLKLYSRKEVLAHEAVHAMRAALASEKYEEHFAYQTSHSAWRRYLGPIFRTSNESTLFLCALTLSMIGGLFFAPLLLLAPLVLTLGLARLIRAHRTLKRCQEHLSKVVKNPAHLLARLTDEEIDAFAKLAPSEILAYAQQKRTQSLRWKLLFASYFQ